MHIHIVTAIWQRPRITGAFLNYFDWLRGQIGEGDRLTMCVAGSEGRVSQKMCDREDVFYVETPNNPLGAKWNTAMMASNALDWDYALILGSDDFINKELLLWFFEQAQDEVAFAGVSDLWLMEARTGRVCYWAGYDQSKRPSATIGAGRLIRREIIDDCNWTLWKPEKLRGLDKSLNKVIKPHLIGRKTSVIRMLDSSCRMFDLKTSTNLNRIDKFETQGVRSAKFFDTHYPLELKREIDML